MEIDVNIIPVPALTEIPVSLITGQGGKDTTPLMVDYSHVIPMMVEDVTKIKVKPKRKSKTLIATGDVKVVSLDDVELTAIAAHITELQAPNIAAGTGVKPEAEDVNRTVQEFPQVQHITMPVSAERRLYSIDLGDIALSKDQTQNIINYFQNAPLSDPGMDAVVEELDGARGDIYRAAYFAERAEMQAAHLDSPTFDTNIKTPLVK